MLLELEIDGLILLKGQHVKNDEHQMCVMEAVAGAQHRRNNRRSYARRKREAA